MTVWKNHLEYDHKCCNVLNKKNWENWILKIAIPDKIIDVDYLKQFYWFKMVMNSGKV